MFLQAGVDLGTVIEEHAASQRKRKKKGRKEVGQGVEVRPKRRAPITQVLMVGGATRMPAFQHFVKNMTGLQPRGSTVDPDEVGLFCILCCLVASVQRESNFSTTHSLSFFSNRHQSDI